MEEFADESANRRRKGRIGFWPKEKNANEVMRFCPSFRSELFRHLSVGGREVGDGMVDWDWLATPPSVEERGGVRYLGSG